MNDNLLEFKRNPFVAPQEIEASFLFFNEVLRLGMQFCTTPPLFNRVSLDARGVRLGTGLVVSHTRVYTREVRSRDLVQPPLVVRGSLFGSQNWSGGASPALHIFCYFIQHSHAYIQQQIQWKSLEAFSHFRSWQ